MYQYQPSECIHPYNMFTVEDSDPRTEWTDQFGTCSRCGETITYRTNNSTGCRELY